MLSKQAEIFKYSFFTSEEQFRIILLGVFNAYKRMLKECSSISNDENLIRNFLHENYLNNDEFREEYGLIPFTFEAEPQVISGEIIGFIDIKIKSFESNFSTKSYYNIECKRLDGNYKYKKPKKDPTEIYLRSSLATEYVRNGIYRFVEKKYPTELGINGMIGFVVSKTNINSGVNDINQLISTRFKNTNTTQILEKEKIITGFNFSYTSKHLDKDNCAFKLYHMMLDYSKIVS